MNYQGSPVTEECSTIEYQDTGVRPRDSPEYILHECLFSTRYSAGIF